MLLANTIATPVDSGLLIYAAGEARAVVDEVEFGVRSRKGSGTSANDRGKRLDARRVDAAVSRDVGCVGGEPDLNAARAAARVLLWVKCRLLRFAS